jgi:ABC-type transport system involved in multi-copper enzyme maturation permease subunit
MLKATYLGLLRDRLFHGIAVVVAIFALIPSTSVLSMRQVGELGITLALSANSFILLLIAIFLGGTALWKDIDRRYIHSALGLPISRTTYLLGKFCGVALFLLVAATILAALVTATIWFVTSADPTGRTLLWTNILLALFFDALKYLVLMAAAFLLSAVSTSFFLPIFGTITLFLAGTITQEMYDYLQTPAAQSLSPSVHRLATGIYYLLPNFTIFDLKANAIYSLPIGANAIVLTLLYGLAYGGLLLSAAALLFARREFR